MSQEPEMVNNESNVSDNPGFRTALYFNFQPYDNAENRVKEVTEGIDAMKISGDLYATPTITPRQSDTYKNFISSDLLKRLEDGSPIPQKHVELKRKPSEIYLYNCDKDETEGEILMSNMKEASGIKLIHQGKNMQKNQNEEETKDIDKSEDVTKSNSDINENVITNMTNFTTRNYKLKSSIMNKKIESKDEENQEKFTIGMKNNYQKISIPPEKEESQSLFVDTINFGNINTPNNNYFSPPYNTKQEKQSTRKDSSPILSYYDGTTEYISQTFFDEFKKTNNEKTMSKTNFIKKVEPVAEEIISSQSNINSSNASGSFFYNSSRMTDDQSSFNSFQLPYNFLNNGGMNTNFLNVNNLPQNFDLRNRFNNGSRANNNFMDFSNNTSNESLGMLNMNMNINKMNPGLLSNGQINNQAPVKRSVARNGTAPNQTTQLHGQMESLDEYTVEMFGRKGWICEMCNNFNYETRQKCNRCGINKTPKKIKRYPLKSNSENKLNYSSNEAADDLNDDSSDKKKKKPFVERVGDWVCIKCKNLNFSFRVVCNRCQLPKTESDKMFEHYMSNLMNYVKVNEMMQQKILLNQSQNSSQNMPNYNYPNNVNNNSYSINSNYFNNNYSAKTNSNLGVMRNPYNSNSNINGAIYNSGSSMSMSNSSNQINGNGMGGQFHIGNVEEDEYYDDEI